MKTGLLIWLLEIATSASQMKQYFIREPDNQTAIEGEQVTLPCRVENKIGLLQWTRDGFGLGDTRQLSGYSRYKLVGSDDEKDWTLRISPVLLEDDALFQCQVGAADSVAPIRSRNAQLTVYVPPEDPYIVQGDVIEATEDRETTLECVSPGGKPAADIYWHDGDGHVIIKNVRTQTKLLEDEKRFNTTSIVTFMPKKRHHNTTFTCSASNIADRSRRSVSILLYVRYAPSVRLSTSQRPGLLREGETIQFKCHAHANPPPLEYSWYVDGQRANGFESDFFLITNISQSYHNAIVKCEVRNEIGKSEETETIQVRYGPRIIAHPHTTSGDLGDTVTLHCYVDSNPPPTYTWTKGLSRQAVGSSQNLTVIVSQRTEGQYYCHSITEGFDLVTTQPASILLRGRPSITSPPTQLGVATEPVQLRCSAISAPEATGVIWTYMGRTVTSGNPKYEIMSNKVGYQFQSTLIIRDSTSEDFGYYGCAVTNSMGSDELSIHLEMQEEFPMLIILIGIFATIIVILLITLAFLLCRRKISQLCNHKEDKPYKQNNLNSISPPGMDSKTTVPSTDDDCWENNDTQEDLYNHRLSGYPDHEFPPKPDLISNGYVPYGTYVRDYNPPFPPSDSQTSLHSASQLAPNHRHSTILNVSDPRYSATYGNPYLRSPPKHSQYSTFSPTESSSTVYPASNGNGHSVSLIPSPASTNTVNSVVSFPRSTLDTPPLTSMPRSLANTPPLHTVPEGNHMSNVPRSLHNGHNGGSIMGIGPGTSSPQLHHRHPVSNDLYAVVSKPGVVSFRNNLNPISSASVSMPNPNLDQSMISTLAESISGQTTSPVNYILDSNPSNNDTGTHV